MFCCSRVSTSKPESGTDTRKWERFIYTQPTNYFYINTIYIFLGTFNFTTNTINNSISIFAEFLQIELNSLSLSLLIGRWDSLSWSCLCECMFMTMIYILPAYFNSLIVLICCVLRLVTTMEAIKMMIMNFSSDLFGRFGAQGLLPPQA